jgi:putative transcriptional regulator
MIKCNLSKFMGIHKMNIQDVRDKTGLHRNTIANLYYERATGIEFATMEKLCKLFGCKSGPDELFEYQPDKE